MDENYKLKIIDSMEKIFPDIEPVQLLKEDSCLKNERYNFQIAVRRDCDFVARGHTVEINCPVLGKFISVRKVGLVPAEVVCFPKWTDDYVLSLNSGLYPDVLIPADEGGIDIPGCKWTGIYFTLFSEEDLPTGKFAIEIILRDRLGEVKSSSSFDLRILDARLVESDLKLTDWIHYDCIADAHGEEVFSPRFYDIFGKYLSSAVSHGQTMLLIPLFTFPLDTAKGKDRDTFQLVRAMLLPDGIFRFDFEKLEKFIRFVLDSGIKYLEFSHLATQWGGEFCPKIMVEENGTEKKMFGWHTRSDSEEYKRFLDCFLPALSAFLEEKGWKEISYFHITDEPSLSALEGYKKLNHFIRRLLNGMPIMDAVSEVEFAKEGGIDIPVAATNQAWKFAKNGVVHWVYYCCSQCSGYVSNRFFNMPLPRTRILGIQLYANGVEGFLHWGFNFYNTSLSIRKIDPYKETDAGMDFPAGDSFVVYPANKGVYESLRLEALAEGIQDYRALKTLEKRLGREVVMNLLQEEGISGFSDYPRTAGWLKEFKNRINRMLSDQ